MVLIGIRILFSSSSAGVYIQFAEITLNIKIHTHLPYTVLPFYIPATRSQPESL